jgi:Mg2+/Co2+ transporter CorB
LNEVPLSILFSILFLLVLLSGFFSSAETGMMALNRYRLRHLVKNKHKGAMRASKLLDRTDELIGIILTGNNLVNFAAAALATIIAQRLWPENPDLAVVMNTIVFTLVVLIFAELTPKRIAAAYPEKVAFPASLIINLLRWPLKPFVWLVNAAANLLLRMTRLSINNNGTDNLSTEELRTLVNEAGALIPAKRQRMLLSILDLENESVNDIMIPRNEVIGIDIEDSLQIISEQLTSSQHTRIPVYKGNINDVVGILHMRNATKFMSKSEYTKEDLMNETREPYFIPESTPLHTQLFNFQKRQRRIALVVDEYGDVQGIVTLEDILEEIVGEFTTDMAATSSDITPQKDGSYIIDGTATIRDINKTLKWALPVDGPKTLSGLIVEYLEAIPDSNVGLKIGNYVIEILKLKGNTVKSAKVSLQVRKATLSEND